MSSIDERVVQMKFDNSQFQKGVADTSSSLDKLKQGLNLDASAKSLQGLSDAGSRFSLAGIASHVENLSSKFSALGIMGITALTNITNKAVDAGLAFAKSFTVAPIMDGFNEYELKMGSIQTILANTAKDGTSLDQVKSSLEELNTYADKTIYNFGDMTRNIGLFTNAGIGLQDATDMIKGFSNEAAMSGTTSANAAGAAYQLSQALSKGKITLEDWKSLTNVGMGNANMKAGIIDIAKAMGTMEKAGVSAESVQKDFNGTLEKGWMTADVMQNYLKIQAGEMNAEQMKGLGLSDDQIANFQKMQKIAEESATKVRTWTQLIGTLKESVGSSWATTFELLLGDFDEATTLFTNISNTLGGMIGAVGDKRNELIKGWVAAGGRTQLIEAIGSAFNSLVSIMKVVSKAWSDIFPPITVDTLTSLTGKVSAFLKSLTPSEKTLTNLGRVFKGVFAVLDIGWSTVQSLWGVFQRLFSGMGGAGGGILELAARFGDFLVRMRDIYINSEKVNAFFVGLTPILKAPGIAINWLVEQITKLWNKLDAFDFSKFKVDMSGFTGAWHQLKASLEKLKPTSDSISKIWEGIGKIFEKALEIGSKLVGKLTEGFSGVGKAMEGAAKGVDFNTLLGMLGVGALAGIFVTVKKFFGKIKEVIESFGGEDEGGGILDTIKEAFGGLTETLGQMQATLKASTLILIAGAIALLTLSVVQLSKIDAAKLPPVLAAITAMFVQLSVAMAVLDKINITTSLGKMIAIGTGMILFAVAINILAQAVEKLGKLDWKTLFKGLVGTTTLIAGLAGAMALMPKNPTGMIGMGIGLIALAVAIKILASAVGDFAGMDWQKMMQGLIGVGMVLGGLAIFTQLVKVNKGAIGSSAGLILLGVALKILASAVGDFAAMDWQKMMQGLVAMGMLLGGLAAFSRLVNPAQMVSMGVSLVIIAASMKIFAMALNDLGNLDWQKMMQGLIAMGLILGGIAIFSRLVNPVQMISMAASMVIIAFALDQLADVLKKMGGMSWEEIGKGLVTLAGSLAILAGAMYLMAGGLPGAAAMLVMAAALTIFVPVLQSLGKMPWEEIWTGIGALALSLTVLGVAGAVLGILSPLFALFGISLILVGTGALLAGAGLALFAVGLTAVAAAGALGVAVLVTAVTALLGLIPYGMTQIGLGLVAFTKVIGENVPAFVEAAVKLLLGFIDGLRQVLPAVVSFIFDMIVMILQTIANNVPLIVEAGFKILIGFLQGIANNIGRVVTIAADIIINFLNGLASKMPDIVSAGVNVIVKFIEGISNNLNKITNAGADLVIAAINAVANTIETRSGELRAAGERLAWAIADGLTGGMASKAKNIAAEAWELGAKAIAAIKGAIDSNSPSKESHKLGTYLSQGFALGISDLGYLAERSGSKVGTSAVEAMKKTLSNAGSDLDANMSLNPVITPVLDLSYIKKDAGLIDGMIQPTGIELKGSYAKASVISADVRTAKQAQITTETPNVHSERDNITFIQNNNSPKALSRVEIYRQTKNQLSVVKK